MVLIVKTPQCYHRGLICNLCGTQNLLIAKADKKVKNSVGKTAKEMICTACSQRARLLELLQ